MTGEGLAANINKMFPRWLTTTIVSLLVVANTINIAADIGAMGGAVRLLIGGPLAMYVIGFGALCIATQVLFSYERTVGVLKWLVLALFSYVAVILIVHVPWRLAISESLHPWSFFPNEVSLKEYTAMVVAMLGTAFSPYLFFWHAGQEVEDNNRRPESKALRLHSEYAAEHLSRIKQDTYAGMTFANVIALCIVIAAAVTLNHGGYIPRRLRRSPSPGFWDSNTSPLGAGFFIMQGITNIQTSSQAAEALRPVAGEFAFAVFALGIIGTGLITVPVLAGSAAYAVSELYGWKASLSHGFHEAKGFYLIIIAAIGIGTIMGYLEVDPINALVWSAIVNGVISVPIMAALMWIGQSKRLMGKYTISQRHRFFGWTATLLMAVAVVSMLMASF